LFAQDQNQIFASAISEDKDCRWIPHYLQKFRNKLRKKKAKSIPKNDSNVMKVLLETG
jgi:hypothetical protein